VNTPPLLVQVYFDQAAFVVNGDGCVIFNGLGNVDVNKPKDFAVLSPFNGVPVPESSGHRGYMKPYTGLCR